MSIRFSVVKLSVVMTDETVWEHQYIQSGHPDKEMVRRGINFEGFCGEHITAIAASADVTMYISGHTAGLRDADDDHIKMISVYEADSGKRFVDRSNVSFLKRAVYFYTPPFGESKQGEGLKHE